MIPNHVPQEVLIISDESLINSLKSEDQSELEAAQIIIHFLSSKVSNKSVVMIPKIYRNLIKRSQDIGNKELERYIESFCCEARIGFSERNPNSVEYRTVIDYLLYSHYGMIFFITEDKECLEIANSFGHSKLLCGDVQTIKKFILTFDKEFEERLFREFYDTSGI